MVKSQFSIRNSKGFTMIELITVFSIMGILSLLLASILNFGMQATKLGNEMKDEHVAARNAAMIISNELRTALDVVIVEDALADNIDRALYLDGDDFYRNDGFRQIIITKDTIQSITFTIEVVDGRVYVDFSIVAFDGYQVDSKVYLVNIDPAHITEDTGGAITYDYSGNGAN